MWQRMADLFGSILCSLVAESYLTDGTKCRVIDNKTAIFVIKIFSFCIKKEKLWFLSLFVINN